MKILSSSTLATAVFLTVFASAALSQGRLRDRIRAAQERQGNFPATSAMPNTAQKSLDFDGLKRTFLIHVPAAYDGKTALPLVLCFHGTMGTGPQIERSSGFSALADRENFIVVYPDGVSRQWNDGRGSNFMGQVTANDLGFVTALLAWSAKNYRIDAKRIYATGMSNGAIFSDRLGVEMGDRFAAIAPVAGNFPIDPKTNQPYMPKPLPGKSLSVLMINGTADPLVKWEGGEIKGGGGRVTSVAQTVAAWVKFDGCAPKPTVENLPDKVPDDDTTVRRETYSNRQNGSEVVLDAVVGGGHGWPDSTDQKSARRLALSGTQSREINATAEIWAFFKRHSKMN